MSARARKSRKRAVTVRDALEMVQLADLEVSPDGKRVLYTRSDYRPDEKSRASSIWCIALDGGPPRRLTRGPRDEQPRWSPDGATVAFVRKAEEDPKCTLCLLPFGPGECSDLTELDAVPRQLRFTPSGKRLSYIAASPDPTAVRERKEKGDDARVFIEDEEQLRLWTLSVTSGRPKPVSPEDLTICDYDWLPGSDNRAVVTSTDSPRPDAAYLQARLGILDTTKGRISEPWAEGSGVSIPPRVSGPRVSPDGRFVAFIGGTQTSPLADQPYVLELETGEVVSLASGMQVSAMDLQWTPDAGVLLVLLGEGVETALYATDAASRWALRRVCGGLPSSVDYIRAAGGGTVVGVGQDVHRAPELWAARTDESKARALTEINEAVGQLTIGRTSTIEWASTEGLSIEGLLTLPPGFKPGAPHPTVLLVHGGPAGRFRTDVGLAPRQLLAAQGYVVLSPNPRGSSGYGESFLMGNVRDWGGGDYRDLMAGLDHLIEKGIADPERLGIYGASYGGYMTAWTITQTNRFKAAVCQCGLTNLYSMFAQTDITPGFMELYFGGSPYDDPEPYHARSAMTRVNNVTTPTLLLHGDQDVRVPIAQSYELYWALRRRGVDTQFVIYPREPHSNVELFHQADLLQRVVEWFGRYL